jgi:hypothetical protein
MKKVARERKLKGTNLKEDTMDLDTFITILYVFVDNWYNREGAALMQRHAGRELQMSDSEVLTVAIAGQWREGVPWRSERSLVRYMLTHGRQWFPGMLKRSGFNYRVRQLWAALVRLQQVVAQEMTDAKDLYEVVDCVPLPACSRAQASQARHWLYWSRTGRGGTHGGWFFGEQLLMAVTSKGVITGWLLGDARTDDRWLLQAFLSQRAGKPELLAPARRPRNGQARQLHPPVSPCLPLTAVGVGNPRPYLADRGFNGARWQQHWRLHYAAEVITIPPDNAPDAWAAPSKRWLKHHRQKIDTTFAFLTDVFGLARLQAHSCWGQITRLAAKCAAFNFAIWLNHRLARPLFAFATLLC